MNLSVAIRIWGGASIASLLALNSAVFAQPMRPTLFVGNNGTGDVSVMTIGDDGTLSDVADSPFSIGPSLQSIALTADGTYLLSANSPFDAPDENLWLLGIAQGGRLSASGGSPFASGEAPLSVKVVGNDLVVVTNAFGDEIWTFNKLGGELSEAAGSPCPTGTFPNQVAVTPDGRFVYASLLFGGVDGWQINGDEGLESVKGSPFMTPADGLGVVLSQDGDHLYVAGGASSSIGGFGIQDDGTLMPLPGSPFESGGISVRNLAITPNGRFLFAVHALSNTITTLQREVDGSLAQVSGGSEFAGAGLGKAKASNRFLFVTRDGDEPSSSGVLAYCIEDGGLLEAVS